MISEPPGSLFFFCFNIECQLVRLWMTCALILELYGSMVAFFNHPFKNQSNASDSAARRCSEQRLNLAVLMQQSPFFRRRLSLTRRCRRWSGAVVQDNCETYARTQFQTPHTLANIEASGCALALPVATSTSSYLVDPASSHMLVLKIKPCMSKYKHLYRETANGSLKQLWFI